MKQYLAAALIILVAVAGAYILVKDKMDIPSSMSSPEKTAVSPVVQVQQMDLFFAGMDGRRLALERREISGASIQEFIEAIIAELVSGPDGRNRVPTLPAHVSLRSAYFKDNVAYVDFTDGIRELHPGGAWTEVLTVYSIVNTLTENFSEIKRVQFLIEGRESNTLAGHVDISAPLAGRIQLLAGDWE